MSRGAIGPDDVATLAPKQRQMWSALMRHQSVSLRDMHGGLFVAKYCSKYGLPYLDLRKPGARRAIKRPIMGEVDLFNWVMNFPDEDIDKTTPARRRRAGAPPVDSAKIDRRVSVAKKKEMVALYEDWMAKHGQPASPSASGSRRQRRGSRA